MQAFQRRKAWGGIMVRFVFCILALLISTGAQAHKSHHHPVRSAHAEHNQRSAHSGHYRHYASHNRHYARSGHQGYGVPWCGIFMMQRTGIHGPGNLAMAREWAHVGQPASGPSPGIIGVMSHHVFQVVQVLTGNTVLAISGNDGGAVRTRPRSTAGVIAWRRI